MLEYLTKKATSAYSGYEGCCCGCNGNHYSKENGDCWNARKMEAVQDEKLAERNIRRIAKQILEASRDGYQVDFEKTYIAVAVPTAKRDRCYIIYFN